MSPFGLAWRGLIRQPARAALAILGVTAACALLFDMLLLSRGLLVSFRDLLDQVGYDVRVSATSGPASLGPSIPDAPELAAAISRLPEVAGVLPVRFGRAETVSTGEVEGFELIGVERIVPGGWMTVVEADAVDRADGLPPIFVNRNLARRAGLVPGATLHWRALTSRSDALPPVASRVAGIAEFPFDWYGALTAAAPLSTLGAAEGEGDSDAADLLLVASRPPADAEATVAAIGRLGRGVHAFSNEQFVERFGRTEFAYFRQISFVLSTITLFFAFILVTTLLTVSVNQRFAEIAALRALGFTRRRVATDLLVQSALLVGAGGLLGLPAGALLARWLDAILRDIPGIPERLRFFVFEPRTVVLYIALLALAGVASATYPIWLAARLPIAATLREELVS